MRLTKGASAEVGGYSVTYVGKRVERSDQRNTVSVDLLVARGSDVLGTYAPAISTYRNANQGIGTPSVRTGLLEDVYLTLISSPNETGRVTVGVAIQSMTLWIWVGGALMACGTIVALVPKVAPPGPAPRRPRAVPTDHRTP